MILGYPLLWASLIAPPLIALTLYRLSGGAVRIAVYAIAGFLFLPSIVVAASLYRGVVAEGVVDPLIIDLTESGLGVVALVVDGVSAPIVLGVSLVTSLVSIYSLKYMEVRISELKVHGESPPSLATYYLLYTVFSSSMLGMAYSANFILFFIFLELSLVSSFLLILYYGYGDRRRIALLYFVWTNIGGALMLAGALLYGIIAGNFDSAVPEAGRLVYVSSGAALTGFPALLAGVLVLVGLLIKMAVIGVHIWLPYAHAEAPTPVSALLSPNLVGIGAYGLVRFALPFFPETVAKLSPLLLGVALATIVYGGLVALMQNDFKRLLAYSSISQMGYLLLGFSTLTPFGLAGSMFFYLSHAIGKAVLFMTAGVFITELGGLRNVKLMGGLARAYPAVAAASIIGFLHLAGIPPAFGFWGELLIVLGLVANPGFENSLQLLLLTLILILAVGVTAAYSFITARRIFFGKPRGKLDHVNAGGEVDEFKSTVVTLAIIGILLFLLAGPLFDAARYSFEALMSAALG